MKSWVNFGSKTGFGFATIVDNTLTNDYRKTFQAWVRRDPSTSLPAGDETLFEHHNIWKLTFEEDSYDKVSLWTFGRRDLQVTFPRGVWVYITSWHDSNQFALQITDEFGVVYSDGSVTRSINAGASPLTDPTLTIANKFHGYISGFKYYSGIITNMNYYDFTDTDETAGTALFYYRFNTDGLYSGSTKMLKNYVSGRTGSAYGLSVNSGTFSDMVSGVLTKELSVQNYYNSSIDYNVTFDGFTCQESDHRLYFENGSNYAITQFQFLKPVTGREFTTYYVPNVGESYSDITVEFWFKLAQYRSTSWKQQLITITRNERPFFTILLDEEGQLYCIPLYEQFLNDPT